MTAFLLLFKGVFKFEHVIRGQAHKGFCGFFISPICAWQMLGPKGSCAYKKSGVPGMSLPDSKFSVDVKMPEFMKIG